MSDEEISSNVFEIDDEENDLKIKPLVSHSYDYDNMVNNPIIKPIAEADKSNRDLTEMVRKKMLDAKKDKAYLNTSMGDIPEYSDSPFIAKLIRLAESSHDVIKLQDLKERNYQHCIREMVNLVYEKYGVLEVSEGSSQGKGYVEPEEKIPFGDYKKYLSAIVKKGDGEEIEVAKEIVENYEKDKVSKTAKDRFNNSCTMYYKEQTNNKRRNIAASILRMELEVK